MSQRDFRHPENGKRYQPRERIEKHRSRHLGFWMTKETIKNVKNMNINKMTPKFKICPILEKRKEKLGQRNWRFQIRGIVYARGKVLGTLASFVEPQH